MKNFEWEIIECGKCNKVHAMPYYLFDRIYDDTCSNSKCPYCGQTIGLYNARKGTMNADRGVEIETTYVLK